MASVVQRLTDGLVRPARSSCHFASCVQASSLYFLVVRAVSAGSTTVRKVMAKTKIIDHSSEKKATNPSLPILELINKFAEDCSPMEQDHLIVLEDKRTGAVYIECHVLASKLVKFGTADVPLDPDDQPDYRANRELVEDHVAFAQMKDDANGSRTFSNIVCEFNISFDPDHPIKIVGGQHRYTAIVEALKVGVDVYHGLKVYFGLDPEQRLDVQLISNTNIAVSTDLFDRMQETLTGPQLRDWCQKTGLLAKNEDFADKRARSNPITVRAARSFIVNYYRGTEIKTEDFDRKDTTPILCKSGQADSEWDALKTAKFNLWGDPKLLIAGTEFSELIAAQRLAMQPPADKKPKAPTKLKASTRDAAEKATNYAVLSSWAFVAGVLSTNQQRLFQHFSLKKQTGRDPLNVAILAKGRHKTDAENYRGLGYRTDAKERARMTELFFLQAEKGEGITANTVDVAIKRYHAKEATLEVIRAEQKGEN